MPVRIGGFDRAGFVETGDLVRRQTPADCARFSRNCCSLRAPKMIVETVGR